MLQLLGLCIDLAAGFIVLLPLMLVFQRRLLKKDQEKELDKTAFSHMAAVNVLGLALLAVFSLTGIPSLYSLRMDLYANLIPFTDLLNSPVMYIQNILLFVPVGFLLPMLWKPFEKKRLTIAAGFLLSLFIEIIQLFSFRFTDIDDLIMNTLGAAGGYFLYMQLKKAIPRLNICSIDGKNHWKWEPYASFSFAWLSVFLVQPLIAGWLWEVLY